MTGPVQGGGAYVAIPAPEGQPQWIIRGRTERIAKRRARRFMRAVARDNKKTERVLRKYQISN